ncbi:DUF6878 family protein [Acidiphilium multivorum]|uniref:DUF6878 family protein n=1 Tax=Acidiphilium multivorum TaxID=62140 RepID=UPI0039C98A77
MTEDDKSEPERALIFDYAAWEQKQQEYDCRFDELLLANKTALFDVLSAAGIEIVDVNFDGYGDSGQIESMEAKGGDHVIELPATQIDITMPVWDSLETHRQTMTVHDAIEHLVYAFLRKTHDGWANDDGAYGDFTFDVADRTITLDYHERYTDTNYSHHSF